MFRIENRTKNPLPLPSGAIVPALGHVEVALLDESNPVLKAWRRARLLVVSEVTSPISALPKIEALPDAEVKPRPTRRRGWLGANTPFDADGATTDDAQGDTSHE